MPAKRHLTTDPQVSFAGEAVFGLWCAVCQEPWRVRVPLSVNGLPAGGIEICPGCGSGHDKPGVYLTSEQAREPLSANETVADQFHREFANLYGTEAIGPQPPRPRRGPLLPRLARSAHARACGRAGTIARECAYADCQWPGFHRLAYSMQGDEGTWRYVFCRKRHRTRWAADNGLLA